MNAIWLFLCTTGVFALQSSYDEPQCSRFAYEYKLLERQIDLELTTKRLISKVEEQQKEINNLKRQVQPSAVFFEVKHSKKHTYAAGDRLIFTHPVYNNRKVYDVEFGYFQPPLSGTYFFSVSLCTAADTYMVLGIMKDSEVLKEFIVGDDAWHTCGTTTLVTYITNEHKIWIKALKIKNGIVDITFGISSFSGVLVNMNTP